MIIYGTFETFFASSFLFTMFVRFFSLANFVAVYFCFIFLSSVVVCLFCFIFFVNEFYFLFEIHKFVAFFVKQVLRCHEFVLIFVLFPNVKIVFQSLIFLEFY